MIEQYLPDHVYFVAMFGIVYAWFLIYTFCEVNWKFFFGNRETDENKD